MKRRLSSEEWFSLAVLFGLSALLPLIPEAGPFFFWTAGGVAVLAIAAVCDTESRRELILLGFLLPASLMAMVAANRIVVSLTHHTMDATLEQLDHGFSAGIYGWVRLHGFFRAVLGSAYYALPFFGAVVLSVSPRRMDCARAWIYAALAAPIFYIAFPATGPAHIADPYAPRNCIPSLHLTWALLCTVYAAPRWRWAAIAFAVLTAAATLGTGEHYVIDLVLAAPYSWAVCQMVKRSRILPMIGRGSEPSRVVPASLGEAPAEAIASEPSR